ncbi:MAG TPA: primosomal protein N', partial [Pirellulaceae bacterium]|nr:primosomal protein N' [Pirellulaceae bacterium]
AVFAPVPRLGLIVIDEEHDGSFKQDQQPRYHAREVARRRTQEERVPLVLGSATPSLESYHRALSGVDRLLSLPRRVLDLPLPNVATIDMRADYSEKRKINPISQKLRQEVRYAIDHGGQVILLLNRRGHSTRVQCPGCREVIQCPDCSIPLTYHKTGSKLVCHYCDYETLEPEVCPSCGFETIRFSGLGTQRLESYVQALFPGIPCTRMDADTMKRPGSHEAALSKFRKGETKILLGTQMIAKGLDFPNVTLVGVINADSALHMPDFRAAERTFGLVTQVAGRSGRSSRGGRVLVQTFTPDHPAIVAAARHDYPSFADYELPLRESASFPPFGRLIRIVVKGDTPVAAHDTCQGIAERIKKGLAAASVTARILGPAKAPVERLRGKWRFHLLIVGQHDQPLQAIIRSATADIECPDGVQWIIDVDAQDLQ